MAVFEWTGAVLGLLGAFLLATHSAVSRYGWLAFLIANFAMMAFAVSIGADPEMRTPRSLLVDFDEPRAADSAPGSGLTPSLSGAYPRPSCGMT